MEKFQFFWFVVFVIVACCIFIRQSSAYSVPIKLERDLYWERFKNTYNKSYDADEDYTRRWIFEENLEKIFKHNTEADLGRRSYRVGVNSFTDLTTDEMHAKLEELTPKFKTSSPPLTFRPLPNNVLPDEVDWRKRGFVTDVKNQGECGGAWIFSMTGSLEGQQKKKSGQLISLSEQQLIDCPENGTLGCNGRLMFDAFDYIKKNGGLDTEASYPFEGTKGPCRFKKDYVGATVTGSVKLPSGSEKALKAAVATVGPVSVAVDASQTNFQLYVDGIYDERDCSSALLNHAMLVVGYGSEDGKDYWIVKNSWGPSWGMQGYIKMSRNKSNQCGIATFASYPLV